MSGIRRAGALALLVGLLLPAPAWADTPSTSTACPTGSPSALVTGLDGIPSACPLAPDEFLIEAAYLQNASRVGGTAVAVYPQVNISVGLLRRVKFTFDAPSEIAESRPGGLGAYPISHLGFGLTGTIFATTQTATAILLNVSPPDTRFVSEQTQARYLAAITTSARLSSAWTIGGSASETSSAKRGLGLLEPAVDIHAGYTPIERTQLVAALGERIVTRHAVAQAFGDVGVEQTLTRKLLFTVGLGTTFNAVNKTKPHYLATGLVYAP
jgi:hypothetical protein